MYSNGNISFISLVIELFEVSEEHGHGEDGSSSNREVGGSSMLGDAVHVALLPGNHVIFLVLLEGHVGSLFAGSGASTSIGSPFVETVDSHLVRVEHGDHDVIGLAVVADVSRGVDTVDLDLKGSRSLLS